MNAMQAPLEKVATAGATQRAPVAVMAEDIRMAAAAAPAREEHMTAQIRRIWELAAPHRDAERALKRKLKLIESEECDDFECEVFEESAAYYRKQLEEHQLALEDLDREQRELLRSVFLARLRMA